MNLKKDLSNERLEFGKKLFAMRQSAELSPEEVSVKTKIRAHYIQLLENGEWSKLPERVFVRGFIDNLCTCYHKEKDSLLAEFDFLWPDHKAIKLRPSLSKQKTKKFQFYLPSRKHCLFGFTLLVFFGGLTFYMTQTQTQTQEQGPTSKKTFEKKPQPSQEETAQKTQPAEIKNEKKEITLKISNQLTLEQRFDNQPYKKQLYSPGTYKLYFLKQADFILNDTNALMFYFSGREMKPTSSNKLQVLSFYADSDTLPTL